jgi:DNA-binding beta-propeller fold protein YncE
VVAELSIRNAVDAKLPPREGEAAQFTLAFHDQGGTALAGLYPNVWLAHRRGTAGDADSAKRCTAQVAAFLTGNVLTSPALDLNVYYVLALNGDGTLTVVDPRFSFGGTQLLAMLQLDGPGYDWALASGSDRLFVSVPAINRVELIDTRSWKLVKSIDAGAGPRRIVPQPDGRAVWVAVEGGVTALRADDGSIVSKTATGRGEHDLAFSPEDHTVVVTNRGEGTAAIVDARNGALLERLPVGAEPLSVTVSPLGGMAYVAGAEGAVTVIDPKRRSVIARMTALPGLTQITMAPGGRHAFLANPARDVVQIIDVASNRIVQSAAIPDGPFDVNFSSDLAYVRRLRSEAVLMIPLAEIGKEGAPVPVVDFPAGEAGFGKLPRTSAGPGIVAAPDANAVIVANPADGSIYYYKEGMAAPIGHFSNYGHPPQSVMVLDRSVKEWRGKYSATSLLPEAGEYDVAVFVNTPRVVTCFPLTIAENPEMASKKRRMPVTIEPLVTDRVVPTGATTRLAFRLRDVATKQPRDGLKDAMVLMVQAGGSWSLRQPLTAAGEGRYETDFVPPQAGVYYIYVGCPSIGLRASNPQFLILEAR